MTFPGPAVFLKGKSPGANTKRDLARLIKKLEDSQKTCEYLFYYQQFVDVLSHHIVVCSPVLVFLSQYFPG